MVPIPYFKTLTWNVCFRATINFKSTISERLEEQDKYFYSPRVLIVFAVVKKTESNLKKLKGLQRFCLSRKYFSHVHYQANMMSLPISRLQSYSQLNQPTIQKVYVDSNVKKAYGYKHLQERNFQDKLD